jgi:hypothetical protein
MSSNIERTLARGLARRALPASVASTMAAPSRSPLGTLTTIARSPERPVANTRSLCVVK